MMLIMRGLIEVVCSLCCLLAGHSAVITALVLSARLYPENYTFKNEMEEFFFFLSREATTVSSPNLFCENKISCLRFIIYSLVIW